MTDTLNATIASNALQDTAQYLTLGFGIGLVLWAAVSDFKHYIIPNLACLGLAVLAIPYILVSGGLLTQHILIMLAILAIGFLGFAVGLFGAGDAKLLAALGLWVGPAGALQLILMTTLFGGVLAVIWVLSGPVRTTLAVSGLPVAAGSAKKLPYGLAIGAAGLIFLGSALLAV